MKTNSTCRCGHGHARPLDVINNVVTIINAIGLAILALCMLNMQDQIKVLFDRDGDTAIKVSVIEKTLESREKIFSDHLAWSLKYIKNKPVSNNDTQYVETQGGN